MTRIKVICFLYNEEFLLPFFLEHYRWADVIHAVVSRSTDRTRSILELASDCMATEIMIEDWEFPAGFDDTLKRDKVNDCLRRADDCAWQIVVDADELVWPAPFTASLKWTLRNGVRSVHEFLDKVPPEQSALTARMWSVFRHATESDLVLADGLEPVLQRRHGDSNRNSAGNAPYQKPIILRANRGLQLGLGNHSVHGPSPHPDTLPSHPMEAEREWSFDGVHWQNADPSFCVARRVRDRRDRLSETNRRLGLGSQHLTDEAAVLALCEAHRQDPQCF